jgi:TolB-like protein
LKDILEVYCEKGFVLHFFVFTVFGLFAQQPVVAVAPFDAISGISATDANMITRVFFIRLGNTNKVSLVDRNMVDRILREHQFQAGDWSNAQKTAELGEALNADWIVRGELEKFGTSILVTVQFYDIRTFRFMGGSDLLLANANEAMEKMDPLVDKLVQTIANAGERSPATRPSQGRNAATSTLSWAGQWIQSSTNRYMSNRIGDNQETWVTLTITAPTGGTKIIATFQASSEAGCDFGYASRLNSFRSTQDYQMRLSGNEVNAFIYDIPQGTHTIHFGYKKDQSNARGNDNMIVEIKLVDEIQDNLTWFGTWTQSGPNIYVSNRIGDNQETWQMLIIKAPSGGIRLRVGLTASSESGCDFGYALRLNGQVSTNDPQLRVSGTETNSFTYNIPQGVHIIYFGYKKDQSNARGSDNVTVEVRIE